MRFQRIARNLDARFDRRDAVIDNQSHWHAPQSHAYHFAHADRRVGDACPEPNAEKVEKNDCQNETEDRKDRNTDKIKSIHAGEVSVVAALVTSAETVAASLCEA